MSSYIRKTAYTGPVQGVVLDWAGTAVDFGCIGPVAVFRESFQLFDIEVSVAEVRQFMGLMKKDHIRSLCRLPAVSAKWKKKFGQLPDETDVEALYAETEPMMVSAITRYCDPIPGLLETVEELRKNGIRIGSIHRLYPSDDGDSGPGSAPQRLSAGCRRLLFGYAGRPPFSVDVFSECDSIADLSHGSHCENRGHHQ